MSKPRSKYKTKYSDELKEQMFDMYVNKGMTFQEIHPIVGAPTSSVSSIVRNLLVERGISKKRNTKTSKDGKPQRKKYKTKYSDELKEQMFNMYHDNDMKFNEIAQVVDVPATTIGYIVRKLSAERGVKKPRDYNKKEKRQKGRKNTTHKQETKLSALHRVIIDKEKVSKVSKDMGILDATLRAWVKRAKSDNAYMKILESNVSEDDHIKYTDNTLNVWYIDEIELRDLKQLLDEGKDLFTCSYIMGVEGIDFERMLQSVIFLE